MCMRPLSGARALPRKSRANLGAMTATDSYFEAKSYRDWRERVASELPEGASFEAELVTRTLESLDVDPLYAARPASTDAGGPNVQPTAGGWRIAQAVSHPIPREAGQRALEDLTGGATGMAVQLEEPGPMRRSRGRPDRPQRPARRRLHRSRSRGVLHAGERSSAGSRMDCPLPRTRTRSVRDEPALRHGSDRDLGAGRRAAR